jgi:hypothetical protein
MPLPKVLQTPQQHELKDWRAVFHVHRLGCESHSDTKSASQAAAVATPPELIPTPMQQLQRSWYLRVMMRWKAQPQK